jgi:bifunctional aspartokinase / homoserine dehydrogenase 1
MALIVMKFGGTSVGDAECIQRAAGIVEQQSRRGDQVVAVVSALSKVTDQIVQIMNDSREGNRNDATRGLEQLSLRHEQVLGQLFSGADLERVKAEVKASIQRLADLSSAVSLLGSATAQVMDMALPLGEQMSARVFAACLQQMGGKAEFVDSARVVVTDEKFGDASPDMDATRRRSAAVLKPMLSTGKIPVVTGYSGVTPSGQITTLGRGGSDYSGTILGAALDADEIWIWTDVDGVLTADPRVCPEAMTLPAITFSEAIELSYYGAKVIHRKAIRPAMESNIPVWIKNSFKPEVLGTEIVGSPTNNDFSVKAVTTVTQASLITLSTRHDVHFAEIFGRLFLRLGHEHIDILFSTQSSSEDTLGLVLREQDTEHVLQAIQRLFRTELKHGVLNPVSIHREVAVVAVLGSGMKGTCGILGRLFSAVATTNASVIAVAQGASELNICFAVAAAKVNEVVKAVHKEFLAQAIESPRTALAMKRTQR